MRHTPRGELIRRRLTADPVTMLKARRLWRSGMLQLQSLGALMGWLRRCNRLRSRGRRLPLIRRYAASVMEHVRRSARLERVCLQRPDRPAEFVSIRWVVAGEGPPFPRDVLLPHPRRPRGSVIRRVRQRALIRVR